MSEEVFSIFFIAMLGLVVFLLFTRRGRGVMYSGRIIKTYGGVSAKRRMSSNKIKVHVVDGGSVRFVGLEISTSSIGSYEIIPVSFPASEARQLAELLIEAAEYQENA
jgi:hypothetical protein